MDNKKITTTELDFSKIKDSLKSYLQGQPEYADYDFDGSALSVLLDVLAYNTHYNALYNNLSINEAFLDSASKRASVVSRALELGYTPDTARCATAIVNITMINNAVDAPDLIEIPKYSPFTTIVDGVTYTFYTTTRYTAVKNGNQYIFEGVVLKEGTPLTNSFVVNNSDKAYTIPNVNVDDSTLVVSVQENSQTTTTETFIRTNTILNVTEDTPVYYLRETDKGLLQIEFGDGVVGRPVVAGNIVTVEYLSCNLDAPNGARTFTFVGAVSGSPQIFITTTNPAFGGSASESVDSIKWTAPRAFAAQKRCVIPEDYAVIIKENYNDALSVSCWGGEDAKPPQYGKVFISIITKSDRGLSDFDKDFILRYIVRPANSLTITPEIVDPQSIDLQLKVSVYVDPQKTSRTFGDIETLVRGEIEAYNTNVLRIFGSKYKHSNLSRLIDMSDPGISNNSIRMKLRRSVEPVYNINARYEIDLGNPIFKSLTSNDSVITSGIFVTGINQLCFIDDIPETGRLRLFYRNSQTNAKIFVRDVGSIDYDNGIIIVENLNISGIQGVTFDFFIEPNTDDIVSNLNQFVRIDTSSLSISMIDATTADYTFTPVRF